MPLKSAIYSLSSSVTYAYNGDSDEQFGAKVDEGLACIKEQLFAFKKLKGFI